ncbi:MAG TPA: sensor histidine kinase [Terriglobales bacterium]|nr:sensor histidine kinase [Candidatus Dormibacteraeota bacterium]HYW26408.1 sensor histidine kinase [Terriglobales bacterium]
MSTWRNSLWGPPSLHVMKIEVNGTWGRRYARTLALLPYVLLGISTVLSQTQPFPSPRERLTVLGLAAAATVWLLLLHTLAPPSWRERTGPMLVYFTGLLALSAALVAHSAYFIAFACIGFFQAFFLLPTVPAFLAVAATSVTIYLVPPDSGFKNPANLPLLVLIVAFQTVAVGGSSFMGARISEQQEQRRQLLDDLQAAQEENAGLHAQLLTQAREAGMLDERQRLAREIHDTVAQGLTGIVTQLEAAEAGGGRPDQWRPHVVRAGALARESLREARRALQALGPEPLQGTRLPDAIAEMARGWAETSAVALNVETSGLPVPLLTELEVTLFRAAQEALANVARHASATRVGLTLTYTDDLVLLDVRDDGVGFAAGAERGFGLRAMEQRLRMVGGTLEVESAPGAGTAIAASVPAIPAGGGE